MTSSISIAIQKAVLPVTDDNVAPTSRDLFLEARTTRRVQGILSVSDVNSLDTTFSEILLHSQKTYDAFLESQVSLAGTRFYYEASEGFKGEENFYILTLDNGNPPKAVVRKSQWMSVSILLLCL